MPRPEEFPVEPVADAAAVVAARAVVGGVAVSEEILAYVVDLVRATREDPALQAGASPRAGSMMVAASRAVAALSGRDYVVPDDVKRLVPAGLAHRLVLAPGAEIEGLTVEGVVQRILGQVPAPR